jgi:tetratricopeptide (TPR) repeat protein
MKSLTLLVVLCASLASAQSLEKGIELVRQQKYEAARAEFEAVLKAEPGNARAAALLAAAELQTGFVKSGIARAEILLEKDPNNADLHELLGQAYLTARDWEKAEREWRWMTRERPNSEQAHMQLAAALLQRDKLTDALAAVNRALEINGKRSDARSLRANILASLGRMDAAAQDWTLALAADPDDAVALSGLAVYLRERDPDRALVYAQRAVDLSGGRSLGAVRVLALVRRSRGELGEAREVLERARLTFPNNELLAADLRALSEAAAAAPAPKTAPAPAPEKPSVLAAAPPASPPPAPPPTPAPPALPPEPLPTYVRGLTLGTTASDLLPLLRLPQRALTGTAPARVAAPARAATPTAPAPPPSTARLTGLTLGASASDLLPLARLPQRPAAVSVARATRPPATEAPAASLPALPLFLNQSPFVYGDIVSAPSATVPESLAERVRRLREERLKKKQ